MRLKSETDASLVMCADTLRALAIRFDGLDMMPMGAESKQAQLAFRTAAVSDKPRPRRMRFMGAASSRGARRCSCKRKLLALPVPVTCSSVKRAWPESSKDVICSPEKLSPSSPCTCMSSMGALGACRSVPWTCTTGGGQRKRFSDPYDFCATLACRHLILVMSGAVEPVPNFVSPCASSCICSRTS